MRHKDAALRTYGDAGTVALASLGLGTVAALLLVPTFVVGPFIVKAFKPEWSYGRRLGASLGAGILLSVVTQVSRSRSGKK